MEQYYAPLIMFSVTVIFATLFFMPVTIAKIKNGLVEFYWNGFWMFLALITSVAGGANTLMLLRIEQAEFSAAILLGILAAFILFVVFGWVRLMGAAALHMGQVWLRRRVAVTA